MLGRRRRHDDDVQPHRDQFVKIGTGRRNAEIRRHLGPTHQIGIAHRRDFRVAVLMESLQQTAPAPQTGYADF